MYDLEPTAINRSIVDARFESFTLSNSQTFDLAVANPDPPGAVMVFTGTLITTGTGNAITATFPPYTTATQYNTTGLYLIPASELVPILGESGRVKALGVNFESTSINAPTAGAGQFNL